MNVPSVYVQLAALPTVCHDFWWPAALRVWAWPAVGVVSNLPRWLEGRVSMSWMFFEGEAAAERRSILPRPPCAWRNCQECLMTLPVSMVIAGKGNERDPRTLPRS